MPHLLTPRDYLKGHPATPDAYVALAARRAAQVGRALVEDPRPVEAYVSAGQWVADCPQCGAGIAIHPEWPVAACFGVGCHRVFRTITVPATWRAIEAILMVRPRRAQHWLSSSVRSRVVGQGRVVLPAESLADLARENLAHGLPPGQEGR